MAQYTNYILVCGGTGCRASQSEQIIENLRAAVEQYGLEDTQVIRTGCFGFCEKGPVVKMIPDNTFYVQVQPSDTDEIVREHLVKGRKVERLLYMNPENRELVPDSKHIRFYKKQLRIALRNCGFINPENIDEYIARDGYVALGKALVEMTPEEVIKEIMDSGLRGRGGGGFPTGLKWQITRKVQAPQKYVVCNADEGDPGAFMDRSILEGDPHSIVEAMAINGYCTGASKGLVYIRAEYPLAVERLKIAIRQAKEYGLLGENIFGTDFSFDIEIRYGAGAFVCGEETALIHSMEGLRGEATVKPPFPSEHGYKGCPTNVNNVETYANIPMIIKNGADWYSRIGTPQSPGTKAFALTGNVKNTGLIEVPMGISLREIIFDIGGGIKDDKGFKAVQIGGPSGGCLVESQLDSKMDFDSLSKIGAMIGSGGLVVMDEDTCMVEVARFFMNFTQRESCGKCVPCREGTKRMLEILERIVAGNGEMSDLDELEELADMIENTALCGLGKSAPKPVVSTIHAFRKEYEEHIVDKKCRAGVCSNLRVFKIDPEKCKGCSKCAKNCPVNAITGKIKSPFTIDHSKCIKCGSCIDNCPFGAVYTE